MNGPNEPPPNEGSTPVRLEVEALVEEFIGRRRAGEEVDSAELILDHPAIAAELERRLLAAELLVDFAESRGEAAPGAAGPRLPEIIGRYEIRDWLGQGSSANVYRAYDPKFGRLVALKVFHAHLSGDSPSAVRFRRDARLLARLRHSHIVPLHETGTHADHAYIDVELIVGPSLEQRLRGGARPDFRAAAELVRKVALALHHAHQAGIVHRDVKPSNILIDHDGEPQLTDFGLARNVAGDDTLTATGQVLGTPAYMSPEQARGHGHRADARSDVFSLGVVLYRMLTGRLPFVGDDPAALIGQIVGTVPPPPRKVRPDVPRDLEIICLKALEKDPADRFPTAEAFAEELRRWRDGETLIIQPPTRWKQVRKWLRAQGRTVRWLLTVAAGLAAVSTMLGWSVWVLNERASLAQARQAMEAELRAKSEAQGLIDQAWLRVRTPEVGRRFETQKMLRELARPRRLITDPEEAEHIDLEARSVFAASLGVPDVEIGERDQYFRRDRTISAWPMAIHPNGKWLAFATPDRPVRWDRGGPPPEFDDAAKPWEQPRVDFSPDGKYLTFAPASGGLELWKGDVSSISQRLSASGGPRVLAVGWAADGGVMRAAFADGRVRSWTGPEFEPAANWSIGGGTDWEAARFSRGVNLLAMGDGKGLVQIVGPGGKPVGDANGRVRVAGPDVNPGPEQEDLETRLAVEALAWSPNGQFLAVGSKGGTVELWDWRKGQRRHRFTPFTIGVGGIEFTRDGRWLVAGSPQGGTRFWDVATGELLLTLNDGVAGAPYGFSQDERWLALGSRYCATFAEILVPEVVHDLRGHTAGIEHLAWSLDGRRLATLDAHFYVNVWDAANGKNIDKFRAPVGTYWASQAAIALNDDGSLLAFASGGDPESKVLIRDASKQQTIGGIWRLGAGFEFLSWLDGRRFQLVREQLTADGQNVISVTHVIEPGKEPSPAEVLRPRQPQDEFRFLDAHLTPDGRYYCWIGPRKPAPARRMEVWDVRARRRIDTVPVPTGDADGDPVGSLDPAGRFLWVSHNGDFSRHDLRTQASSKISAAVLAASRDGKGLEVQQLKNSHRWLSFEPSGCPWLRLPTTGITVFSDDGRRVASGDNTGLVTVIDLPALQQAVTAFEAGQAADQ